MKFGKRRAEKRECLLEILDSAEIVEKGLIDIYRIPRYILLIEQMERASRAASVNSASAFDKSLAYVLKQDHVFDQMKLSQNKRDLI